MGMEYFVIAVIALAALALAFHWRRRAKKNAAALGDFIAVNMKFQQLKLKGQKAMMRQAAAQTRSSEREPLQNQKGASHRG